LILNQIPRHVDTHWCHSQATPFRGILHSMKKLVVLSFALCLGLLFTTSAFASSHHHHHHHHHPHNGTPNHHA